MVTFSIPIIIVLSVIAALFFCFFANLIAPKYLKKKLFSKEWWLFVSYMTAIFAGLYVLISLFGDPREKAISMVGEASYNIWKLLVTIGGLSFAATFYIKKRNIRIILFWLAGLTILLINLYYSCFLKIWTFQVIAGLLFGIWILAYGPTGKLDKMIGKIKERKQGMKL